MRTWYLFCAFRGIILPRCLQTSSLLNIDWWLHWKTLDPVHDHYVPIESRRTSMRAQAYVFSTREQTFADLVICSTSSTRLRLQKPLRMRRRQPSGRVQGTQRRKMWDMPDTNTLSSSIGKIWIGVWNGGWWDKTGLGGACDARCERCCEFTFEKQQTYRFSFSCVVRLQRSRCWRVVQRKDLRKLRQVNVLPRKLWGE